MWLLPVVDEVAPTSKVLPYYDTFEGGTVDGWTVNGAVTIANSAVQSYAGTKSLAVTWTSSLQGIRRTVTGLTIGKTYRASAAVYVGRASGVGGSVGLGITGMTAPTVRSSWNNAWGKLGYTFVATATSHQLEIAVVAATTGTDYVDDVRLDVDPIAITDENSGFEKGTVGDWTGVFTSGVANSSVRSRSGTKSLAITYPTTTADTGGAFVQQHGAPLTVGKTYWAFADVYVPSASPKAHMCFTTAVGGNNTFGRTETSVKDQWQSVSASVTATTTNEIVGLRNSEASTAGQQMWVDNVEVSTMPLRKEDQSFENGTTGGWFSTDFFGNYDVAQSVTNSTVRASDGQRSLLITWGAPGAKGVQNCVTYMDNLVVGQTYIWEVDVWVPAGSPPVRIQGLATGFGEFSTTTGQWETIRQIWYNDAAADTYLGVAAWGAAAGNQVWIDNFRCTQLISYESRNFEAGSVGDWVVGGSVPPTITNTSTRPHSGLKSMLLTWGTAGTLPLAQLTVPTTAGEKYTFSAWVYVPTGSPGVATVVGSVIGGNTGGLRDQWVQISSTFTATGTTRALQIWPSTTPTAGNTVYIDDVQVVRVNPIIDVEGSTFEGGTDGVWTTNTFWSQPAATVTNSSVRAYTGTKSLLITWPTTTNGSWIVKQLNTEAGKTYTAYVWVYVPTGSPDPHLSVPFKYSGPTATTTAKDQWVCLTATWLADSNAEYLGIDIDPGTATAGQQCWVDFAQVYEGVEQRRNIWKNPTASVDTQWWYQNSAGGVTSTIARVAPDTSLVVDGKDLSYLRFTYNNAGTAGQLNQNGPAIGYSVDRRLPLEPGDIGKTVYFSAYVRESQADRTSNLWFRFFSAANASLGGPLTTVVQTGGQGWMRISGSGVIPATADHMRVIYESQGGTIITVGDTVDIGACLVEISSSLNAYFDGDTTDVTKLDYRWLGKSGDSQSVIIGPAPTLGTVAMTAPSSTVVGGVRTTAGAVAMTAPSTTTAAATTASSQAGAAAMTAPSTLAVVGVRTTPATVAMTAPSTLSSAAVRTTAASVAMTAPSSLTIAAIRATAASATMSAPSTLTAAAVPIRFAAVSMTAPSTLVAAATTATQVAGAASMTAPSTLTAAAVPTRLALQAMTAPSELTPAALGSATYAGAVAMTAPSGLIANALPTLLATQSMTAPSSLTAAAIPIRLAAVAMTAASVLITAEVRLTTGTVVMVAPSALVVAGVRTTAAAVSMTATSVLTGAATSVGASGVQMFAPSALTAGVGFQAFATVTMTVPSILTAAAVRITSSTIVMTAPSTLLVAGLRTALPTVVMTAPSLLAVVAVRTTFAQQTMTASSVLLVASEGEISGIVSMVAPSVLLTGGYKTTDALANMVAASVLLVNAINLAKAAQAMTTDSVLLPLEVRVTYAIQVMLAASILRVNAVKFTPTGSPFWFWNGDEETPLSAWYWNGVSLTPFVNFEITT